MNTAILSTGGVLLYLPHHLDLASKDSVGLQYMHECIGASQGYHGVYRAAQTVLSRSVLVLPRVGQYRASSCKLVTWYYTV